MLRAPTSRFAGVMKTTGVVIARFADAQGNRKGWPYK